MHGYISYVPTRLPSEEENNKCRWIQFTSEKYWKPYDDKFKIEERYIINHNVDSNINHQNYEL